MGQYPLESDIKVFRRNAPEAIHTSWPTDNNLLQKPYLVGDDNTRNSLTLLILCNIIYKKVETALCL